LVAFLDEKHRRQFVGMLASQLGYGGIQYLSKIIQYRTLFSP